jgi:hypothetical protein
MTFDATISFGTILQLMAFALMAWGGFYAMRNQVSTLALRMKGVEDEVKKVSDVLVQLARQDERLNGIDRRLDSMDEVARRLLDVAASLSGNRGGAAA